MTKNVLVQEKALRLIAENLEHGEAAGAALVYLALCRRAAQQKSATFQCSVSF